MNDVWMTFAIFPEYPGLIFSSISSGGPPPLSAGMWAAGTGRAYSSRSSPVDVSPDDACVAPSPWTRAALAPPGLAACLRARREEQAATTRPRNLSGCFLASESLIKSKFFTGARKSVRVHRMKKAHALVTPPSQSTSLSPPPRSQPQWCDG